LCLVTEHRARSGKRQLGELLVDQGWVAAADVQQALADQGPLGVRLASLLVGRGLLDVDHAARALALQHGVPAALARHLESRDRDAATWLRAQDAHAWQAVPIGLARNLSVVVCVRDPDRENLREELERALRRPVTLAVACAAVLTPLLREVYGPAPDAFDIDLTFPGLEGERGGALDDALDPFASGSFTLAALDDDAVRRDPSQQGVSSQPRTATRSLLPGHAAASSSAAGRSARTATMPPAVAAPAVRAARTSTAPPMAAAPEVRAARTSTAPPMAAAPEVRAARTSTPPMAAAPEVRAARASGPVSTAPGGPPLGASPASPSAASPPDPKIAPALGTSPSLAVMAPPSSASAEARARAAPSAAAPARPAAASRLPAIPSLPKLPSITRRAAITPPSSRPALRVTIPHDLHALAAPFPPAPTPGAPATGALAASPARGPSALGTGALERQTVAPVAGDSRAAVVAATFELLRQHWAAAVLFSIKDGAALGQHGFGALLTPAAVEALVFPLHSTSILRAAWETGRVVESCPPSAVQDRLLRLLGAEQALAAPVVVAGRVVGVLVAAAACDAAAPSQLTALSQQLGEQLARVLRSSKM
jgi:Type II secretion system (T2SS), protein E, N-terminal domain